MFTRIHAFSAATLAGLLALWGSALQAQPYPYPVPYPQPYQPPVNPLPGMGERLEGEAEDLQALAQTIMGNGPGASALMRDLVSLRTAINQFRTGIDVQADPQTVQWRFARVARAYRAVRSNLNSLPPDQQAALNRRAAELDGAFRDVAAVMRY